jgi:hypothetical protein
LELEEGSIILKGVSPNVFVSIEKFLRFGSAFKTVKEASIVPSK